MTQLEPKRFQFTSADGLSIACVKWSGHHHVRGVVQTAHGLGEHTGRYAELAETLVQGEFVVYGSDHNAGKVVLYSGCNSVGQGIATALSHIVVGQCRIQRSRR